MVSHSIADGQQQQKQTEEICTSLQENFQKLQSLFMDCQDIVFEHWRFGPEMEHASFSVFFESLTQQADKNYMKTSLQDLVPHELGPASSVKVEALIEFFENHGVSAQSGQVITDLNDAVQRILQGYIVIFVETWDKAITYKVGSFSKRQIAEPNSESVVQGPRESTIEELDKNIGLIRSRIKTHNLKFIRKQAGRDTKTEFIYGYIEGAVNPETLDQFKQRIKAVENLDIIDTSYIEEILEDYTYSPFPQFRYTERPDVITGSLLDGKIIVMVSGSPSVLLCPGLFIEFFHTADDYYNRGMFTSAIRNLRVLAFLISLLLPALYIALSTFNPELIPTVLLLAILNTREGIPFPAFVEAFIMEIFLQLLKEAGIRLPKQIGSAVSIVGALIIGEAAIRAGIASPIMIVVVALTGIASFSMPQYGMATALRLLRFPFMMLAASLGIFGLMIGSMLLLLHLVSIRSLGQPYFATLAPLRIRGLRDVFVRFPLKYLLQSPRNRHMHKKPNE